MSRIEELPDDFDESLHISNLNSSRSPPSPKSIGTPPSTSSQSVPSLNPNGTGIEQQDNDSTTPALPPPMASIKSSTPAEVLSSLNRTPLFMTSLDDTDGAAGENVELEALKALAYEGTPAEVAENFREQGNECFRARKWTDAVEFYTKGIVVLQDARRRSRRNSSVDGDTGTKGRDNVEKEMEKENSLEEACLVNRAACNLELKNYRRTTNDCAATLLLNPSNVKAWYRSARACLALDKIPEAQDACSRGLQVDPNNAALTSLTARIAERKAVVDESERKKTEREDGQKAKERTLRIALKARNISSRTTAHPPETQDAIIHLSPNPLSPTSTLNLPVLLLYPLHAQTDLIKSFPETTSLSEHLSYILPLPWDIAHDYRLEKVDCYMETKSGGLIKVGKKMALAKVLGSGQTEVVDGLVRMFVVPTARAAPWIEEFKKSKGVAGTSS